MPFPDSPRVVYARNPLQEVICQVRFPPILRIEAEPPAAFQDGVRSEYPLFRELPSETSLGHVPPELANFVRMALPSRARGTVYEFSADKGPWSITLARDALALRTTQYRQWEEFWDHLKGPLESLNEQYKPAFFSRVGLRYVDVIQRSKLGLTNQAWSDLLNRPIAGEFAAREIAEQVEHAAREVRIKLTGDGWVTVRHGQKVEESLDEACFVIDSDFFIEGRLEPHDAIRVLNEFNRKAGRLFRWCIQDVLHDAMGPENVGV